MEAFRTLNPFPFPKRTAPRSGSAPGRTHGATQHGVAAVEFAMLLPLLMFLVVATIQVADAFYYRKLLLGAAHSGARTGVSQASTQNDVTAAIQTYLGQTRLAGSYDSTISGVGPGVSGDSLVVVTLRYNFPLFATLPIPGWTEKTVPISATVTLRHE